MRRSRVERELPTFETVAHLLSQHPTIETWESVRTRLTDIGEARKFYTDQPGVKAVEMWNRNNRFPLGMFYQLSDYLIPLEQFVKSTEEGATSLFAFVQNGKWAERGEMGWFGCVSDEKDNETWHSIFNKLLDQVGDDELLTVVDCHI